MGMIEDLNPMSGRQLGELMAAGHPIDLDQLADREYRGISLGIPGWVEKLAWKTFKKVFHREPETGKLRGWNVRMQQTGLHGECIPIDRKGQPKTFGHYEVVPRDATHRPTRPCEHAAFIDYRSRDSKIRCSPQLASLSSPIILDTPFDPPLAS